HPDYGLARVRVYPDRHPIVAGLADFELQDERYSYLRMAPDVVPLATHRHDGIEHPLLWARTWTAPGADAGAGAAPAQSAGLAQPARVVYDALGHDVRSYDSPEHAEILRRSIRWLAGRAM